MLKEIRTFFSDLAGGEKHPAQFDEDDYRVAAAALLVHLATLDHDLAGGDRERLHALLKSRFDLDDAATEELIDAAVAADRDAVDFFRFTSILMRSLDEPGRRRIIEMMWELVYADNQVTEFEDNVMWRVADLLGVSTRERVELRRRASGEKTDGDNAA